MDKEININLTNEERMLQGYDYKPSNDLIKKIIKNKALVEEYNLTSLKNMNKRIELLNKILGFKGENVFIYSPFNCDYGKHISIDEGTFINHNCVILDEAKVIIGKNVRIAPNVGIYTVNHVKEPIKRKEGYEFAKTITIEDNVWIGGNSAVLPGVTIGENSIIGAGSVVNKDIPRNVIAAGNPCKVIKNLTEDK